MTGNAKKRKEASQVMAWPTTSHCAAIEATQAAPTLVLVNTVTAFLPVDLAYIKTFDDCMEDGFSQEIECN